MVIQCKGPNLLGKEVIKAYGCIHIPTTPGRHTRYMRMFCPIHDNFTAQLKARLFGPDTDFTDDPEKIANADGREITTVTSVGFLKVVFQISQRNFGRFGYKSI
jgi:B9 domain-containing protein 1